MATKPKTNYICTRLCVYVSPGVSEKCGCLHARWCPKFQGRENLTYKKENTTH